MTSPSRRTTVLSTLLFALVACGPGGESGSDAGGVDGGASGMGSETASAAESPDPAISASARANAEEARARLEASEGGRLVLRAIEAHGGLERWFATPTSSFGWEYSNVGANLRFKTRMVAHNRSRHVYHDVVSLGTPDEPRPFEGRMAWNGEEAWFVPADVTRINSRFWALTGYYFQMIPFVFADPGVDYELLPDEELDGETYDMVEVSYEEGVGDANDYYITYVDQESGLVHAIRYVVTFGGRPPGGETLFYYEDYNTEDGLTVPTGFRGYGFADGERGSFRNEAWTTDIDFGVPFDSTRLVPPDSARIDPLPGS